MAFGYNWYPNQEQWNKIAADPKTVMLEEYRNSYRTDLAPSVTKVEDKSVDPKSLVGNAPRDEARTRGRSLPKLGDGTSSKKTLLGE